MKLLRSTLAAIVACAGFVVVLAPQTASAHHPDVSGVAECVDGDTWSVIWTAEPWDDDSNLDWWITSDNKDDYSPTGSQPADRDFTRTATYPTSQDSASETVAARWSNDASGEQTSDRVYRPDDCGTTGGPCVETHHEYKYEREVHEMGDLIEKETRTKYRNRSDAPWGPYTGWEDWPDAEPVQDDGRDRGPLRHDSGSTWYRQYRYVVVGEYVKSTDTETTGWLSGPPDGDGWTQIDEREQTRQIDDCTPCPYDETLPSSSPDCIQPCEYDDNLPADSPDCFPPCEYDDNLPADSPDCFPPCIWDETISADDEGCQPPAITAVGICFEEIDESTNSYWYEVHNPEGEAVTVTWADGSVEVPADGSELIQSMSANLVFSVDGTELPTGATHNEIECVSDVEVEKIIEGPAPGAETLYTIRISRLVVDDDPQTAGDETQYEAELTFQLGNNESTTIPLPSTLNPEGIEYKIEEIEAGGADATAITPDTFSLTGHLGEKISVQVINSFAAVEIEKTVDVATIRPLQQGINYTLSITNTGALPLRDVVIDDRLPDVIVFDSYTIEGGASAGSCTLAETTIPQLVTCTLIDPVPAGEVAPVITLITNATDQVVDGEQIVNQSRVIGRYDAPVVDTNAQIERFTEAASADLTCEPTAGEVCHVSPRNLATVTGSTTTTTTTPMTTTTTTIVDEEQLPPTTPPTTAVGVDEPDPIIAELPPTGSDSNHRVLVIGALLLALGVAILGATRRKQLS